MNELNKVETITQEYLILALLLVTPNIEIDIEVLPNLFSNMWLPRRRAIRLA